MAQRDARTIERVLTEGVEEVLPGRAELASRMRKGKIRLYLGVDPTKPDLHLGHAVPLRKLRQFQDLGHEAILLFGTFTAQIGDPTGRDDARPPLSEREVKENMASYKRQAGKILDLSRLRIMRNGDWFGKMKIGDMLSIASRVTVARLLERDMFQARMREGREVWMHELFYPLLQGYDSVAMDVELEIGATDQMFNMLIGRRLQQTYNSREKYVLTTPLLMGLDGRKMSKSFGNTVNLLDAADDMYGKIMSLRDDLILHYFELCTDVPAEEAARLVREAANPRDAKMRLAREIVGIYRGDAAASRAEREFIRTFREKRLPSHMPEKRVPGDEMPLADLLVSLEISPSKGEARRLVSQGGVRIDGIRQDDPERVIAIRPGAIVQAGKRRFVRVAA